MSIVVHFDYVLECGHTAIANVVDMDVEEAYHIGSSILCPDCRYQSRKVVGEKQTKDGVVVEEIKPPVTLASGENPTPVE